MEREGMIFLKENYNDVIIFSSTGPLIRLLIS